MLKAIRNTEECDSINFNSLRNELVTKGIVNITSLYNPIFIEEICKESLSTFMQYGKRKDFISVKGGGTPRHMFTVDKASIDHAKCINIHRLYDDPTELELARNLQGDNVLIVPYEPEKYVINALGPGSDTHGWHFDDYSLVKVVIIRADEYKGGELQYIPYCNEHNRGATMNVSISSILQRPIISAWYPTASIYFMRARECLHRITSLNAPSLTQPAITAKELIQNNHFRMTLAMSYAIPKDLEYSEEDHTNIEDLYG